jgi:hypothetical protein
MKGFRVLERTMEEGFFPGSAVLQLGILQIARRSLPVFMVPLRDCQAM